MMELTQQIQAALKEWHFLFIESGNITGDIKYLSVVNFIKFKGIIVEDSLLKDETKKFCDEHEYTLSNSSRIEERTIHIESKSGYIYLQSFKLHDTKHKMHYNIYKIGETTKPTHARLQQYTVKYLKQYGINPLKDKKMIPKNFKCTKIEQKLLKLWKSNDTKKDEDVFKEFINLNFEGNVFNNEWFYINDAFVDLDDDMFDLFDENLYSLESYDIPIEHRLIRLLDTTKAKNYFKKDKLTKQMYVAYFVNECMNL